MLIPTPPSIKKIERISPTLKLHPAGVIDKTKLSPGFG